MNLNLFSAISNVTQQVILNSSIVNNSDLFDDSFKNYTQSEKDNLNSFIITAYVLGTLIVISNLIVVVSSGLILRKGQQQKNTYLLLGNMSLADTLAGISIILNVSFRSVPNFDTMHPMCAFNMGILVCPAMVSIFTVALIAVDRYFYIIHGLYYNSWFSTTRVRNGLACIWIIGIVLGFMPVTGWTNERMRLSHCFYVNLFPYELILFNSILSIVPIMIVLVLYSMILVKALKNVKRIKAVKKINDNLKTNERPELRMNFGKTNAQTVKYPSNTKRDDMNIKKSASFTVNTDDVAALRKYVRSLSKSKSTDDLNDNTNISKDNNEKRNKTYESDISVFTIDTSCSDRNSSRNSIADTPNRSTKLPINPLRMTQNTSTRKTKEPNKWRAITVVMLTCGSFMFTWMPFFIAVIFFVLCEDKITNPKCIDIRILLGGPLATLAFLNSMLNPLIYAWWHKGFQKSIKAYYSKYLRKYFCRHTDFR